MFPIFNMCAKVPAHSDFLQKSKIDSKCIVENEHQKYVDYDINTVENNSLTNCEHMVNQKVNDFVSNNLLVSKTFEDLPSMVQEDNVDKDSLYGNTFDVISNEMLPSNENCIDGNCGQLLTNTEVQSNSKRKNRQKKSIHSNLSTTDMQNADVIKESIGKRSLRNRSVAGKVLNNSKNTFYKRTENDHFNRQIQENSHYNQYEVEMGSKINLNISSALTNIKQSEKLLKNKCVIPTDYNRSYLTIGVIKENSDVNRIDHSVEQFKTVDNNVPLHTVTTQNPNADFTDNDRIVTEIVEFLCQNTVSNTSLHLGENNVNAFSTENFPIFNKNSINTKSVSNCANKESNSTKKTRQEKSMKNKLHPLDVQNIEILLETSCRRQSLRNSTKNEVGDSRNSSQSKFIKKQKIETKVINDCLPQSIEDNNINLEVTALPNKPLFENKLENVKDTKKLFPIFTSLNSKLNTVKNKSCKRKNVVEHKDYETELSLSTTEENSLSKKKKSKIESKMDSDEIFVLKSKNTTLMNSSENYNYIPTISTNCVLVKEETEHVTNLDLDIIEDINKVSKSLDSNEHQISNISIPTNIQNATLYAEDVSTVIETINCSYSKIGESTLDDSCFSVINIDHSSDEISFTEKHTIENEITSEVLDRTSKEKSKKKKGKKSICNKKFDDQNIQLIPEISSRRQSLRSSGVRCKTLNYCESMSVNKPLKKQKHNLQVEDSKFSKNFMYNKYSNVNSAVLAVSMKNKKQKKSKNVKENGKLFPIFTVQASQSNALLKKVAVQNTNVNNNISIDHDVQIVSSMKRKVSKKIKRKIQSGTKCIKNPSILTNENASEVISSIPHNIQLVTEVKKITEGFENSDIHVIEEPIKSNLICIKNSIEKCTSDSNEKDNKPISKFKKKVQYENNDFLCFPIFSHLNTCSTSLNAPNKYYIKDNFYKDIVVPIWHDALDLIDCECMQMIKSKDPFDLKRHKIIDLPINIVSENMWTEFAQNFVTEENNLGTIQEIKSWLLQWKNKFSNSKKDSNDSESYSSDTDDDSNFISNCIIISGAPGSGKTSLVFSLANKLGFTVLEVNASSCRNGRNIYHRLKEALDSYHVESITSENSTAATVSSKRNQNKTNKGKNLDDNIYSSKNNIKNKKNKQGIINFFQSKDKVTDVKQYSKHRRIKNSRNANDIQQIGGQDTNVSTKSCKISGLTIILFDDVDVVFEEDDGFWSTVKGFLKITKKPVIFTVGRNLSIIKSILNSDIKIFNMESASKDVAMMKLKECCKEYLREKTTVDFDLLTSQSIGDLRRSILNAQFWSQNPKYVNKVEGIICDVKNTKIFSKPVCINSFLTGDLKFSVGFIRKLLSEDLPNNLSNIISQYQSLGYDILYNNIYHILYNLRSTGNTKLWPSIIKEFQKFSCSSVETFSETEMWKEACELFECKKKALKNGSCSRELNLCADAFDNFSYADMLKGTSYNEFQCISMPERVKFWNSGLPICSEKNIHEIILDIISFVHIYQIRKLQNASCVNYSVAMDSSNLELEHPLYQLNQSFSYQVDEDLKCISSCLPSSHLLNKRALNLDYLSTIKIMCQIEESRQHQSGKRSGRFLHYFDSISLLIDKKTF